MPTTGTPSNVEDSGVPGAFAQLTRLTCTLASPGHFCDETASVMTPPFAVTYDSDADRALFCEIELVPTKPARWPGRRWSWALRNQ